MAQIDVTKDASSKAAASLKDKGVSFKLFEQVDNLDNVEAGPNMLGLVDAWAEDYDVEAGARIKVEVNDSKIQINLRTAGDQQKCKVKVSGAKERCKVEVAGAKERCNVEVAGAKETRKVEISSAQKQPHPFFLMSIVEEQTKHILVAGAKEQAMIANQASKPKPKPVFRSGLKRFLFKKMAPRHTLGRSIRLFTMY